jgi:hypothetical protein
MIILLLDMIIFGTLIILDIYNNIIFIIMFFIYIITLGIYLTQEKLERYE